MRPSTPVSGATDEDDLESELLFSVREVGVACFPIPGPEVEQGVGG